MRRLSEFEEQRLDFLAWVVVADLPMSEEMYQEYRRLKNKRDLGAMPDAAWAEWVIGS